MYAVVLLFATCGYASAEIPRSEIARDQADLLEVNHYYDLEGRLTFDQICFWHWDATAARFRCEAWRLIKSPHQIPQRDRVRGGYVVTWMDGEILREVRADAVDESWTQHDPELCDREVWPREFRRELTMPRVKARGK